MPVQTEHKAYKAAAEWWQRCRDTFAGSDAVKAQGEKYLPKLSGQDSGEYAAYKTRAMFYNTVERTVHGLVGTVFRKPAMFKVPALMEKDLKDVSLSGDPIELYAHRILSEMLLMGRIGILVDHPTEEDSLVVSREKLRPYWSLYQTESIINWRTRKVGGVDTLTLLVLAEVHEQPVDEFETLEVPQLRVMRLTNAGVTVELYRKLVVDGEVKDEWVVAKPTFSLLRRGEPMTFIPFTGITPYGVSMKVVKPPVLDLVDTALSHYNSSADLENGRHWVGTPQPWASGASMDDGEVLTVGGPNAWTFEEPQARVGMLEFTGQGLKALENALEQKEKYMVVLGARMLEAQPTVMETAESVRTRRSGEVSVLSTAASVLGEGLAQVLRHHAQWLMFETDQISASVSKDFFSQKMSPQEITAQVQAWQAGAISHDTLYRNFEQGEITRPDVTVEQEVAAIKSGLQPAPKTPPTPAATEDPSKTGPRGSQTGTP